MPRVPEITSKDALPADKHAVFDAIAESRGRVGFPFSLLLNSPEAAGRVAHLGTFLRFESTLPAVERELAILTAAREADCEFEWAGHARLGLREGVRQEAIDIIANRRGLEGLTEQEALVIRYGRDLLRDNRVSDGLFKAAQARFDDQGIVELTVLYGYYRMIACALNAFEVKAPEGSPVLP